MTLESNATILLCAHVRTARQASVKRARLAATLGLTIIAALVLEKTAR
jgi:hypothetical protein